MTGLVPLPPAEVAVPVMKLGPRTVRPRYGDLEAATHRHEFVPSGEYVGSHVELCDLCGLSLPSRMHSNQGQVGTS